MAGDTQNDISGWERKTDEHGVVHLVRPNSWTPPAQIETYTSTATPSASPSTSTATSTSSGDPLGGLIVLVVIIVLYFLPWITAIKRGHRNRGAIGVMNLFLGWTGLGWVGALIWAFTANTETL